MKSLEVNEIFYSLQGEGMHTGLPFIFIRLAQCNLRCGYCDTEYSFINGIKMNFDEIIKKMELWNKVEHVLLTGGEPLLQKKELLNFIEVLKEKNKKVFIETNGTQSIEGIPNYVTIILDVKTPSSGHGDSFLPSNIKYLKKSDELKFVIANRDDFNFSVDFIKKHHLLQKSQILFSPVSSSLNGETLAGWILEKQLPIKLNLQIHKLLNIP